MWEIKCFLGYFLRSFVEPVLDQLDITVLPFSLATKIVFEDETKKGGDPLKAVGIEVKKQFNLISRVLFPQTNISKHFICCCCCCIHFPKNDKIVVKHIRNPLNYAYPLLDQTHFFFSSFCFRSSASARPSAISPSRRPS